MPNIVKSGHYGKDAPKIIYGKYLNLDYEDAGSAPAAQNVDSIAYDAGSDFSQPKNPNKGIISDESMTKLIENGWEGKTPEDQLDGRMDEYYEKCEEEERKREKRESYSSLQEYIPYTVQDLIDEVNEGSKIDHDFQYGEGCSEFCTEDVVGLGAEENNEYRAEFTCRDGSLEVEVSPHGLDASFYPRGEKFNHIDFELPKSFEKKLFKDIIESRLEDYWEEGRYDEW